MVSPYPVHDLSFSEKGGSSIKHNSQHSDKTGACEKISVADLAPWRGKTSIQEPKNANRKAHTENVIDLSLDSHHVVQAAKGQKTPARSYVLPKPSSVVNAVPTY